MKCELEQVLGEFAAGLPDDFADTESKFDSDRLPPLPRRMATDRVVFQRATHSYGTAYRVDSIHMYAGKPVLRLLGLAVFSRLFDPTQEPSTISFVHPSSEIRTLVLQTHARESGGLETTPACFRYWASEPDKHPWTHDLPDPWDLPCFYLTNEDDMVVSEEQYQGRDTIHGLGSDRAFARFGELLLNLGCSANNTLEIELEGEPGFRGVAPTSAELRIFLPGADHWNVLSSPPAV